MGLLLTPAARGAIMVESGVSLAMPARVFVGYGYNLRDHWIEDQVIPILKGLGLQILDGKDMHGEVLQEGVKDRIRQCDAFIGFCTLREGHENEAFNTHVWVRDEMVYALGLRESRPAWLPILEVREEGVHDMAGIVGDRQYVPLSQNDRLACVAELVTAVSGWYMRKLQLVPDQGREADIRNVVRNPQFRARYRTRINGVDSAHRQARVERVKGGIYMQALAVPDDALIEIEGVVNGQVVFSSDWESADAVQVRVL